MDSLELSRAVRMCIDQRCQDLLDLNKADLPQPDPARTEGLAMPALPGTPFAILYVPKRFYSSGNRRETRRSVSNKARSKLYQLLAKYCAYIRGNMNTRSSSAALKTVSSPGIQIVHGKARLSRKNSFQMPRSLRPHKGCNCVTLCNCMGVIQRTNRKGQCQAGLSPEPGGSMACYKRQVFYIGHDSGAQEVPRTSRHKSEAPRTSTEELPVCLCDQCTGSGGGKEQFPARTRGRRQVSRDPLWTRGELELFWQVLYPHLLQLVCGLEPVPEAEVHLQGTCALSTPALEACLAELGELLWGGRYSQAVADLRAISRHFQYCRSDKFRLADLQGELDALHTVFVQHNSSLGIGRNSS